MNMLWKELVTYAGLMNCQQYLNDETFFFFYNKLTEERLVE